MSRCLVRILIALSCMTIALGACKRQPPGGSPQASVRLRALFMKQAGYQQSDIEALTREFASSRDGVVVELEFVAYEALHDKIVTAAAAGAGAYDVVLLDCIWPAEFASAGFLLDVTERLSGEQRKDIWPGAMEAVTWQGRVYGMPWLNDVLYLYYNRDLLSAAGFDHPPATWSELRDMGLQARRRGVVEHPVIEYFQQDEGLTIAFAYYLLSFGGRFFDDRGKVAFAGSEGRRALQFMVDGMREGLYDPASLESTYEEVRRAFSQGSALFAVNWAYQWNLANDPQESKVAGHIGVALMPGEKEKSATINGGMGLAVMADSEHPDQAWDYIQFMSSPAVQKRHAANALPIWKSLFDDPELLAAQPVLAELSRKQYAYLRNRPVTPYYSEMSEILARELQAALTGKKEPQSALQAAASAVGKLQGEFSSAP